MIQFTGSSDTGSVFSYILKNIIAAQYVRIKPETWHGHVCVRLQLFGCNAGPYRALGMASGDIPDSAITASSAHSSLPVNSGRLYSTRHGSRECWGSGVLDTNQWLQIDLSKVRFVTTVATQGRHLGTQWVKSYWLSYSNNTTAFTEYKDQSQIRKTFQGNTDSETVVRHLLSPVIFARFVRFNPITWNNYISMRVEVYSYGRVIPTDLGIATKEIPDSQITASTEFSNNHGAVQGRLNNHRLAYAWCAKVQDTNQWLQFNMGHTMLVMGIVTQSRGFAGYTGQMITAYKVLYGVDGSTWEYYKDDPQGSQVKIFTGNSVPIAYVTNMFNRDIKAQYIRINPTTWAGHISLRASVLGRRNGPLGSPVLANQQSPSYITVYKNHDVTLNCEAVGDTPITITWTHKGQVLQSKTSDTHLILTGVSRAQEGFYNCSASNTLGKTSRIFYLHVKEPFDMCSKYESLSDGSRLVTSSSSYMNDDSKLNDTDWYLFKGNHNYLRIPTTCVPENRCGATAPGHMQGALPTVNEGIVKRKVCFHSNANCCHYSVDIYVRNCYMFYVYNLKKLDEAWKARYCAENYSGKTTSMFHSLGRSGPSLNPNFVTRKLYAVSDVTTCVTYCLLDGQGKAFAYNPAVSSCILSNATFGQLQSGAALAKNDQKTYQYFHSLETITVN